MKKTQQMLLMLAVVIKALVASAVGIGEDEPGVAENWQCCETADQEIDLRCTYPVVKLDDEPALQGIGYSARGWRIDIAEDDPSRAATIVAVPCALVNGMLCPAGEEIVVLAATNGEGTVTWAPSSVEKKVYRLTHSAEKDGVVDPFATCYAYFDFTDCELQHATLWEVEVAVLGDATHPIVTVQDERFPWQPIESGVAGAGIVTDVGLLSETTTTAFSFKGRGTFHYEYRVSGGSLGVRIGEAAPVALAASSDWLARAIRFEGFGDHGVAFVYAAAGGGAQAALRNVRWEEDSSAWAQREGKDLAMDLREGVRTPKYRDEVLPFAYSSTNWLGVAGATAESKAHVRVVQMTGSDPAVTNWTTEVAGTSRVLQNAPGEDAVPWKAKVGSVWKATFDILNDETSIYSEEAWFDLRQTRVPGFLLMIK